MATSSQQRSQLFLQTASVNGNEIPREMIATCAYIEFPDLSGPQLELQLKDSTGFITDTLKVGYGAILTCSFGNPQGIGNTSWTDTFFVLKAPSTGDMVKIIAFHEKAKLMKNPVAAPQFFVKKQPQVVASALAGSLTVNADSFKKLGTWHLDMGGKPSTVLAQMAQESGAICWTCRGAINIRSLSKLSTKTADLTYEANNSQAAYRLNRFSKLNSDQTFSQSRQVRYMAYSATKGLLTAGKESWPVKMVSADDQTALNNMATFLMPKFDMEVDGNSALTPGLVIKVLVHSYNSTSGLDESVPTKMIVHTVTHYEDQHGYVCRAILGEIYDGTN